MTPLNSPERNEKIRYYEGFPLAQEIVDKLVEYEKNIQKDEDSNQKEESINE